MYIPSFLGIQQQQHNGVQRANRNYKCLECGVAFLRSGHLREHLRIHRGEKRFRCVHCGSAFSRSGHLKRHSVIHSGEKHFRCTDCDATFTQSGHLTRHLRIHAQGKRSSKVVADHFVAASSGSSSELASIGNDADRKELTEAVPGVGGGANLNLMPCSRLHESDERDTWCKTRPAENCFNAPFVENDNCRQVLNFVMNYPGNGDCSKFVHGKSEPACGEVGISNNLETGIESSDVVVESKVSVDIIESPSSYDGDRKSRVTHCETVAECITFRMP